MIMLDGKVAVVHGAGGAVGGAVAESFAAEGARVFLAGLNRESLDRTASRVARAHPDAIIDVAEVDAFDEDAVEGHAAAVHDRAGRIDVVLNAVGVSAVQGVPLLDLPLADVLAPVTALTTTHLLTARAAARHMAADGRGTVLTLSSSPASLAVAGTAGWAVACAAVEAMSRTLAAELGPHGVRVVCLRPHRILETLGTTPDLPMSVEDFRRFLEGLTLTGRLPSLSDVGRTAAFLASDGAAAMTGSVADLTAGMAVG